MSAEITTMIKTADININFMFFSTKNSEFLILTQKYDIICPLLKSLLTTGEKLKEKKLRSWFEKNLIILRRCEQPTLKK
jgi:hypothetical protein